MTVASLLYGESSSMPASSFTSVLNISPELFLSEARQILFYLRNILNNPTFTSLLSQKSKCRHSEVRRKLSQFMLFILFFIIANIV